MAIYLAIAAYLLGGAGSVYALSVEVRRAGLRSWRERLELSIIAFFLWPLILLQSVIVRVKNRHAFTRKQRT